MFETLKKIPQKIANHFIKDADAILGNEESAIPTVSVNDLPPFMQAFHNAANANFTQFDGDKFYGGFGSTKLFLTDYWTLRQRSAQLFNENLYARGLVRRLVTNEINTGLSLEAIPDEKLFSDDDARTNWSEDVESRHQIWAKNPQLCDYKQQKTFGALQRECRQEALVEGDVLVVLRFSKVNKLPNIELVSGGRVQTPLNAVPRKGHEIKHGVELDSRGRQVAYWITVKDGKSTRLPAFGEKSKRRIAWLVYGTDKRLDELRGQPILSLVLQSLKEIDRFRDAAQRKALVNSVVAMTVEKDSDKMGTKPMTGAALHNTTADVNGTDSATRQFNASSHLPGIIIDEMQTGEKMVPFSTAGTDINFPLFEAAIINAVAWANEIPPGIMTLAFSSNYSSSRGETMEFKMYLDKSRIERAEEFAEPIYIEWLVNEVLLNKISAPGLLEALPWIDPSKYDIYGGYIASDWMGAIKPNVDLKKEVAAYAHMIELGLITRDRAARELNGGKFSKIIARSKIENGLVADSLTPFLEKEKEFPNSKTLAGIQASNGITIGDIEDAMTEVIENNVA